MEALTVKHSNNNDDIHSNAVGDGDITASQSAQRNASKCCGCEDLTTSFRAAVSRARRTLGKPRTAKSLLPQHHAPSAWVRESHDVVKQLAGVRAFLQEHLVGYLGVNRFGGFVVSGSAAAHDAMPVVLSESERERVDEHVFNTAKACSKRIEALKRGIGSTADGTASRGMRLHQEVVVASLYARVESIAKILGHVRKIRLRQARAAVRRLSAHPLPQHKGNHGSGSGHGSGGDHAFEVGGSSERKHEEPSGTSAVQPPVASIPMDLSWLSEDMHGLAETDENEALMYETENQALVQELDSYADAARQLEQKLEEISEMVTFFSTKVQEQDGEIEVIHENTRNAQEHVRSGNDQLTQASEQSFLGRFALLFFLILASAMLLFLDWFQ